YKNACFIRRYSRYFISSITYQITNHHHRWYKHAGCRSIPTVMLILGMQLAEIRRQKFEYKYINTTIIIRMIISPLAAAVLVSFFPINDLLKNVFILLAAMPVAVNTTLLAVQFN